MKHIIVLMAHRLLKCSCGTEITISAEESNQVSKRIADDLLLDRHAAHVAKRKKLGL